MTLSFSENVINESSPRGSVDTRLTEDQVDLGSAVKRLMADLGPLTVRDLEDTERRTGLTEAIDAMGVRQLRAAGSDGAPLASGVEAAVVAEALGRGPADAAYVGPLLAGDLERRARCAPGSSMHTVVLDADLSGIATAPGGVLARPALAIDAAMSNRAYVFIPDGAAYRLGEVEFTRDECGTDQTRRHASVGPGDEVAPLDSETITPEDLAAWTALGLVATSSDSVGAMQGALRLAVGYACERRQYGSPIGSFQAVQHLLAEAHTLVEGSLSITRYAAWGADALEPSAALRAAAAATVYVGRAARTVSETVIQVHGGIGHTWECMAHVFLRRTLHDDALLGGAGAHLTSLADGLTGGANGLS
jgi:hypothetical protein